MLRFSALFNMISDAKKVYILGTYNLSYTKKGLKMWVWMQLLLEWFVYYHSYYLVPTYLYEWMNSVIYFLAIHSRYFLKMFSCQNVIIYLIFVIVTRSHNSLLSYTNARPSTKVEEGSTIIFKRSCWTFRVPTPHNNYISVAKLHV